MSTQSIRIAPSILSADFSRLGEEICALDRAGADYIHVDVMDGHFVPNLTIGPSVVKAIRPLTAKVFDVHLMISPVDLFLKDFADAGADILTVHPEAGPHLHRSLQTIRALGKKAGVALNPATPIEMIREVMDLVDLVLIMTVNPGFGGQAFLPLLNKIEEARRLIEATGRPVDLEVDGGVSVENAETLRRAGVNVLVAGTAVFKNGPESYAAAISSLRGGKGSSP